MISFVRVDDRIIHGQIVTRWAKEFPCDGVVAINDRAATTPVLKQSFTASTDKKVFIWTFDEFKDRYQKVLTSDKNYFLITKTPTDMAKLILDLGYTPGDVKRIVIGPCNDRPGTIKIGMNQSLTQEEGEACERLYQAGYDVYFALIEDTAIGSWPKFRSKFGFK
ncbi:MAG: PTS sugar transporter subunit IIB [Erysipelotrichaceae bacterium]|jgi:PTS system mannose-specific IIB component|nr:PTS sugar transporter subunit IIB [Erysipelotrichaceae bacterium]